jgi:hypothetical protein
MPFLASEFVATSRRDGARTIVYFGGELDCANEGLARAEIEIALDRGATNSSSTSATSRSGTPEAFMSYSTLAPRAAPRNGACSSRRPPTACSTSWRTAASTGASSSSSAASTLCAWSLERRSRRPRPPRTRVIRTAARRLTLTSARSQAQASPTPRPRRPRRDRVAHAETTSPTPRAAAPNSRLREHRGNPLSDPLRDSLGPGGDARTRLSQVQLPRCRCGAGQWPYDRLEARR